MDDWKRVGVGVGVMVIKEGKILLGKRHTDPLKASSLLSGQGSWTMPGGKLDFGESFKECACRETLEETGIKIKNPKIICVSNDKTKGAHFVTIGLLVEEFDGEPKVTEPNKITEWSWFDINNLPHPMFFPSEIVVKNYLNKQFYSDFE
ncbi:NUDIX domain-containing protein [Candidatus Micrarchaeota archaeon]|nr:NUDIX domain-containing protein [Candidatus Micrarchaeota archaeon]